MPSTQATGSDYKIKITSTSSTSQYDYSDNPFTISADTTVAKVTSPSASGITWTRGGFYRIAWSGFTGTSVKIQLYKGTSLNRTIATSTTNSGS